MNLDEVPGALQSRLGPAATNGFLEVLDRAKREAREDVITSCMERFERRLVEEVSALRVQIAQAESTLRADMAAGRVEFLKWSFIFWVGQVLAVAGILTAILRALR